MTSVNGQTGAVTVTVPTKTTTTSELTDFPSQTGNTGLYLQTDGTTMTWASASGSSAGVDSINGQTGAVTLTAADLSAAALSHTHTIANVSGLQSALNLKSNTDHTHRHQDITNFPNVVTSDSGRFLKNASGNLVFADPPVKSDVSQAGAGSVAISNIVKISQSSYDSLVSAGNVDSNTLYIIV